MIEHDALANARGGMDVDLQNARGEALQVKREIVPPGAPQHIGEAVGLQRVVTLEVKQRVDQPAARRIALGDGEQVGAKGVAKARVGRQHLVKGLVQQPGIDGMFKPLRQTVAHRSSKLGSLRIVA